MARKKQSDMAEFQDWLVQVLYLADSTACVYASNVRAVLACLTDLEDEAHVTEQFAEMSRHISRRALSGRKSAWLRFVEFAQAKGVTLAAPSHVANSYGPPALPHHVRAALFFLAKSWKQKQIPALTWAMFLDDIPSASDIPLRDPFSPADLINVPREHVDALKEWSGWYPGEDRPLIPWKRNATIPYPAAQFRRELRLYRKDAAIETDITSVSGSAVDAAALAEKEALLAAQQGVRHYGHNTPDNDFVPSHSTAALIALIEDGGKEVPSETPTETPEPPFHESDGSPFHESDGSPEATPAAGVGEVEVEVEGEGGEVEAIPSFPLEPIPFTTPNTDWKTEPVSESLCITCGFSRDVHAVAHGLTDGTISNCAAESGYPEETCRMCEEGCYGRHEFKGGS